MGNQTNPIEAFKHTRRHAKHEATAAEREANAALVSELTDKLTAHAGWSVVNECAIEFNASDPPSLRLRAKDHIPIVAEFDGDQIKFLVRRGHGTNSFDHLADALEHGEPLKFKKRELGTGPFDTTPKRIET